MDKTTHLVEKFDQTNDCRDWCVVDHAHPSKLAYTVTNYDSKGQVDMLAMVNGDYAVTVVTQSMTAPVVLPSGLIFELASMICAIQMSTNTFMGPIHFASKTHSFFEKGNK